jgi:uncharacterized membrane protein
MWHWLRRSFITGFFILVPLLVSAGALVYLFRLVDGIMSPAYARWLGRPVPGLGLLTTLAVVLAVGAVATNVIGRRLFQWAERYLMLVPVFRTIYAPVKQLVAAFNPDNEYGFKRVVLVEEPCGNLVLGFLTREFTIDQEQGAEQMVAVYVPTNHLYLGDVKIVRREAARFPEITVEEGVRIFLTGGMALAAGVRAHRDSGSPAEG